VSTLPVSYIPRAVSLVYNSSASLRESGARPCSSICRAGSVPSGFMNLSSMVSDNSSSLRRFLTAEMPDVRAVRSAYRAALPTRVDVVQPMPPGGARPRWSTLGAAIDHRLRYALSDIASPSGAVTEGIDMSGTPAFGSPWPVAEAIGKAGNDLLGELERLLADHRPFDRRRPVRLPVAAEARLSRACYAAVWFEELYRSGQLWPGTPLGDAGPDFTLDALLAAVPGYAVDDLAAMAELADTGLASRIISSRQEFLTTGYHRESCDVIR
jgi:hypothetical protein